jgi:hypothetical protein
MVETLHNPCVQLERLSIRTDLVQQSDEKNATAMMERAAGLSKATKTAW